LCYLKHKRWFGHFDRQNHRQSESERAARPLAAALDRKLTIVCLSDLVGDGQSKADAVEAP
jgi:hypothetical protein